MENPCCSCKLTRQRRPGRRRRAQPVVRRVALSTSRNPHRCAAVSPLCAAVCLSQSPVAPAFPPPGGPGEHHCRRLSPQARPARAPACSRAVPRTDACLRRALGSAKPRIVSADPLTSVHLQWILGRPTTRPAWTTWPRSQMRLRCGGLLRLSMRNSS